MFSLKGGAHRADAHPIRRTWYTACRTAFRLAQVWSCIATGSRDQRRGAPIITWSRRGYSCQSCSGRSGRARVEPVYGNTVSSLASLVSDTFQLTSISAMPAVTPAQVSAMFAEVGADQSLHGNGTREDPRMRAERIAVEINLGLRSQQRFEHSITTLAVGQRQEASQPQSFAEILERVEGLFEAAGVAIQTPVESEDDRLVRIANQIASGLRTQAEVERTVHAIAAGKVSFDPNAPAQFGGAGVDIGTATVEAPASGGPSGALDAGPALRAPMAVATTTTQPRSVTTTQPKATARR